jgi:aminoglycoside phosphotransferase
VREGNGGPVAADVAAVVELFTEDLAGVRFPGVDAESLGQSVEVVRARATDVDAMRAALDEAKSALAAAQADLRGLAARGLAYARVFAAGDESLAARVDAVALEGVAEPRTVPRKRRARPAPEAAAEPSSGLHAEAGTGALPFPEPAGAG